MSNYLSGEEEYLLKAIVDLGCEKIERLREENNRLRELLRTALVYSNSMPTTLVAAIQKEVDVEIEKELKRERAMSDRKFTELELDTILSGSHVKEMVEKEIVTEPVRKVEPPQEYNDE